MTAGVFSDSAPAQAGSSDDPAGGYAANHVAFPTGGSTEPRDADYVQGRRTPAAVSEADAGLSLSIAMAAFNEERTIAQAVHEVLACDFPCDVELIVVDDGSTDGTCELLSKITDPRVTVIRHDDNRGKGAALLSALAIAMGTYLLPFDADLEYTIEDAVRLLDPVLRGRSKVVYGVRLFGYNTVYRSYRYALGNKTLTRLTNLLYDACLSDLHTCLKLVPTALLKDLDLRQRGFGLDTEMTAMLLRGGVRPFEVPVSYYGRSHSEGKKITWRDAMACAWILLRVRLRRRPAGLAEHMPALAGRGVKPHHREVVADASSVIGDTGDEQYAPAAG